MFRFTRGRRRVTLLFAAVVAGLAVSAHPSAEARPSTLSGTTAPVQDNHCGSLQPVPGTDLCTHGPDALPPGFDLRRPVPLRPEVGGDAPQAIACEGNGVSGLRTVLIYAHAADVPNRYSASLATIRQIARDMDAIYDNSARATGGTRHVRFVHDASCVVSVLYVALSTTGDDSYGNTFSELQAKGMTRTDRKYLAFVDKTGVLCGVATTPTDTQPGLANRANRGPDYGRVDSNCWSAHTAAHEHMHMMGSVHHSAPNTTGYGHCVDENDVMCYSDHPSAPAMRVDCPDPAYENLFDCNHNDYYSTRPPVGNYLGTNWNTANNLFLIAPPRTISGYVRNAQSAPLAGATVSITGLASPVATTDANGFYSLVGVPDSAYPYTISARWNACYVQRREVLMDRNRTVNFVPTQLVDRFGYRCQKTSFSYITATTDVVTGDDAYATTWLDFPFTYYGQTYNSISISTNGLVAFVPDSAWSPNNGKIPDAVKPNAAIYAFWDDFVVDADSRVRVARLGTAPNRMFVAEWSNVKFLQASGTPPRVSFEIILHENGRIKVQYKDIAAVALERGVSASAGLENAAGTIGLQYSNGEAALTNGLALQYWKP